MRKIGVPTIALALLLLTGCAEEQEPHAGHEPSSTGSTQSAPILQPGAPGESAGTIGPSDVPADAEWNQTDATFVTMMIPHHAQALEMTELAVTRAASDEVKSLARSITAAQGPEIVSMSGWLQARDLEVPAADDLSDHAGMAGMLTPEQLKELGAARGEEFDRLFLTRMIAHHEGALVMAAPVLRKGSDTIAMEMAQDVEASQKTEIGIMQKLLESQ
ncbi:DUF305 domain-containing protein [Nocardioides albus]|uniref:Uncharacterized protein (DUF305 family) n=1 Tax=Nocardioides albus TaxID=1841 RepID=A0A7W5A0X1_9ACTN|nr:DUF305 domain-containing protein [Nocardioides albus]MBB3087469.1 uncharacterized protein (DUF305 family) [Nocardioides albus]GGU09241.1 lipoprotein [Nocardioides albus]